MCGWAVQTKLLTEELRRRGHTCDVLNINESRKLKSPDFVDVQNGFDYLRKVLRFALRGYRFHVHVNAESPKGYLLALTAAGVARLGFRPAVISFHGGLPQKFFPRRSGPLRWMFQLLFLVAGKLTCDSEPIKTAICDYGVADVKVAAIPCFSTELLSFQPVTLEARAEAFLQEHHRMFFCYVSYRPEYRLAVLREAMQRFAAFHPRAGFIWLGFPAKEMAAVAAQVATWPEGEADRLLLLGNLEHDAFLTLMTRCFACIRTPACDGVSSSVLEALANGVPVVASENGRRPAGVITYAELDPGDLCTKLLHLVDHYQEARLHTVLPAAENNTQRAADWVLGVAAGSVEDLAHET